MTALHATPITAPRLPPFPTRAALALEHASRRDLERAFLRGTTPDLAGLVGWEFRGINHPEWTRLFGIKKFIKGFFRDSASRRDAARPGEAGPFDRDRDGVYGYNCAVANNVLDGRWTAQPDDALPKRFGYFRVSAVDPTARDNAYLHAVLLDYGRGGNPWWDLSSGVRDYLVQLDDDLLLGKAYYALGPLRVNSNFFILERHRVGLTDFARR